MSASLGDQAPVAGDAKLTSDQFSALLSLLLESEPVPTVQGDEPPSQQELARIAKESLHSIVRAVEFRTTAAAPLVRTPSLIKRLPHEQRMQLPTKHLDAAMAELLKQGGLPKDALSRLSTMTEFTPSSSSSKVFLPKSRKRKYPEMNPTSASTPLPTNLQNVSCYITCALPYSLGLETSPNSLPTRPNASCGALIPNTVDAISNHMREHWGLAMDHLQRGLIVCGWLTGTHDVGGKPQGSQKCSATVPLGSLAEHIAREHARTPNASVERKACWSHLPPSSSLVPSVGEARKKARTAV